MDAAPLPHDVRGAGHPLVLIHTGSVDRRLWDYQMGAFAERFRVVRYDLRNHGDAPRYAGMYDAGRDLLDVLDAVDVGTAHLVGAGLGGSIALEFAVQHPQRVSALVLAGSGLSGSTLDINELSEALAPMMDAFAGVLSGGDPEPFINRLVAEPHSRPSRDDGRELFRRMLLDNAHVFTQLVPSGPRPAEPPAIGRLGEIRVPTLILVGERDMENVKRAADTLQQGIPRARKVVVAGAGNLLNLDDPDFFNETVINFLSTIEPLQPNPA
jgi:pimeloyl-ACP methyl ester carboxylesterase